MKICTIIGARPQFIKAAPISREIRKSNTEILIHTGQHYDDNMSAIFFEELNIPKPEYNLSVGSGSHGKQTGEMLIKIEEVILNEKPDMVLVYGDTNSTIAGALAASKLCIPVVHVEAGLRSFNMSMPEEQNRILTDHISTLLFCPTDTAVKHLRNEGVTTRVYNVGDVMYDTVLYNIKIAEDKYTMKSCLEGLKLVDDLKYTLENRNNINKKEYYLATIHRAENTNDLEKLKSIFEAFQQLDLPVILPIHPRTRNILKQNFNIEFSNIMFIEPVGYLEMLYLTQNAKKVITDSGGLQKEAFFLKTPCVTIRDQTEWVETLAGNWNILSKTDKNQIISNVENNDIIETKKKDKNNSFGNGDASAKIVELMTNYFHGKL